MLGRAREPRCACALTEAAADAKAGLARCVFSLLRAGEYLIYYLYRCKKAMEARRCKGGLEAKTAVLLWDEATRALNTRAERVVQKAVDRPASGEFFSVPFSPIFLSIPPTLFIQQGAHTPTRPSDHHHHTAPLNHRRRRPDFRHGHGMRDELLADPESPFPGDPALALLHPLHFPADTTPLPRTFLDKEHGHRVCATVTCRGEGHQAAHSEPVCPRRRSPSRATFA